MLSKSLHWILLFSWMMPIQVSAQIELHILGITQDAGLPQLGCAKSCCQPEGKLRERLPVVSMGITQPDPTKGVLLEATPDVVDQWQRFTQLNQRVEPSAIFITHAHMGHYGGLMQLGRESRNANGISVYGHSTLIDFLKRDQPWEQLVALKNILPLPIQSNESIRIGQLTVRALIVPHRDEISATYAYLLEGPNKRALFLPDIDKWEKWNWSIDSLVQQVDYAFLDATFFDAHELPNRKRSEIPHPTVQETMDRARSWPLSVRKKVYLIHFNHTNPLLDPTRTEYRTVNEFGFQVTRVGDRFVL